MVKMRRQNFKVMLRSEIVLSGLLIAGMPGAALSQDADAGPATQADVDDVIYVTAQFREQNVQDTPLSITALDSDLLEARGVSSIMEVGEQAPNVVIKPAGSVYGPASQVFIRGIGQGDTSFALEPGVGVYIDDVYYSTTFGTIFDLVDIDRVEILRGPQGTLAGKNSIGGALKLFSQTPDNEFGGTAEATAGSFNRLGIRASLNIPIVQDQLALRIAAVAKHSDGYVTSFDYGCLNPDSGVPSFRTSADSCEVGSEGGESTIGVRGALRWTPSDTVDISLTGDYMIDRSEPGATVLTAVESRGRTFLSGTPFDSRFVTDGTYINYATYNNPGGVYRAAGQSVTLPATGFSPDRNNNLEDGGLSLRAAVDLTDDLILTSITAYREYHGTFVSDADASPFNFQLVANDFRHNQFSQELRLTGRSFADRLEWTIGGLYFDSNDNVGGRVFFPTTFDVLIDDPVDSRSLSAFAHATVNLTDGLNLTGGLRYSDERKAYVYNREDPNTGLPPPSVAAIDGVGTLFEGNRFDYKLAIDYEIVPDIMVYGQVSTGFRSGGINPRPFASNQVVAFDPETLTAYELGFKSQFADRMVTINAAVFWNKYNNILVGTNTRYTNPNMPINEDPSSPTYNPAAGTFPSTVIINGGEANLRGFEVETRVSPVEGLNFDGSVSFLDFEYVSLSQAALSSGLTLETQRPFTPRWKWNFGAQYEVPLGSMGSLTPRIDVLFQDDMFTGARQNQYNSLESYTLANARLTWRTADESTSIALAVSNLFDTYYYLNKFETFAQSGVALGQPGRPREWRLVVMREF